MKHEDAIAALMKTQVMAGEKVVARDALNPNFGGDWKNELGSKMRLAVAGSQVTGQYTSSVSGGGGSVQGTLIGFINGSVICFLVNWDTAESITAWAGHLVKEGGADVIETLWYLPMKTKNPNDPNELWSSMFAGADRFVR